MTTCEDHLIRRAVCGDQEALLCHQRALAEEITQGAFLLAWRGLPGFHAGSPFRPWLMRILYRHALDVMEKQRAYAQPLSLDEGIAIERQAGSPGLLDPDPQEQVAQREEVRQALVKLSSDQRRVIALRYGADLTEIDIGLVLGLPVGTVKSRLHRARERLRTVLMDEGSESYNDE